MDTLLIILSLFLLMFFAYRGYSVILFAPVFALLAAIPQGLSPMPAYTELFMAKSVVYVKSFFPTFLLGAVFGKLMEETGLAQSIARAIIAGVGRERAMLSVCLSGAVLTYGGVSLFVVVFAIYPFAAALFKEADIPKKLLPATIMLGSFTFTMDAFPGSPQIQNLIPTNFFGTNIYAAPFIGIIGGMFLLVGGMAWLNYRAKQAKEKGIGYGENHLNEPPPIDESKLPDWRLAVLPLFTIMALNFIFTRMYTWDPNMLKPFAAMKLPLLAGSVNNVVGIWSLIIALVAGILLTVAIGFNRLPKGGLAKALNAGAIGSLLAIMNVASEVGYGNVVAALPGFTSLADGLLGINTSGGPLLSEFTVVSIFAGVTGSSSAGMSIAFSLMGEQWLQWAIQYGTSPELLHRIGSMTAGGFDTLPHNGAIITLLAVCGLTHSQSYPDIAVMTTLKVTVPLLCILINSVTGIL